MTNKNYWIVGGIAALVLLWSKNQGVSVPSGPGVAGAGIVRSTVQQPAPGNISAPVAAPPAPKRTSVTATPVLVTAKPSFMASPNNPLTARLNPKQDLYY